MRIESIENILLEVPLTRNFGGSTYNVLTRSTIITRMRTDQGLVSEVYNGDNRDDGAEIVDILQKEIAPLLVGKPQKIEIRGHSSRRPLPSGSVFTDHWQLSYQRCLAVMAELEKLQIAPERLRLSQAAGFEPLAAPDEQFSGGGYARVEVSLLNETTGAKIAQTGNGAKGQIKVTDAKHQPETAHDSHKAHEPHGESPKEPKAEKGHH